MLTAEQLNARLPYCFWGEIDYLQALVKKLPEKARILILGAGPGIQSLALLEARPDLWLLAVDNNATVLDTYKKHLTAGGFTPNVWLGDTCDPVLLKSFSGDVGKIDLLVIDADHSRFAVKRDFTGWFNKVSIGGYIFFHDYIDLEQNGNNGVRADILEIESLYNKDIKFVDQPGISYVVQKVKQ